MKKQTRSVRDGMFLPLDIQMFAGDGSGDGGNDGNPNPKANDDDSKKQNKYTDDDYLKLKASFDKTSSEIAELKKQLKSKQTDEEKKAEEEKLKNDKLEEMQKELTTYKIKSKLSSSFEEKEIGEITEKILNGNVDELVDCLVNLRKAYKEKIYADAKKEFSQSSNIPGGNGDGGDDSLGKQMALEKAKQRKQESSVSWGQFGKK